jgi:hypothetical protein
VRDTARIGDEGKAAERTAPAALLSELSNEQKRHFVLAVTGSGAASRNVCLALNRPTSGCKSPSPDFVPAGAFYATLQKFGSFQPRVRSRSGVRRLWCQSRAVLSLRTARESPPSEGTHQLRRPARCSQRHVRGRRQSRRSPRLGQRLCCLNFWQSEIRFSVSFIARGATTRSSPQLANEATTTPRHAVRCFDPSLSIRRRCARTRILCRTAFSNWALAAAARAAGGRHLAVTLSGNAVEKLF